ncbi:MAG: DNA alkylation repair protein [Acidobacteria bacterium]|nr:DNA alkylation repair protein [Acidobacteriota bacterium]
MTNRLKEDKKSGAAALRPENAARASIASLKACADPKRAEGQRRYFKEQVEFLGLTTPKMKEIEADVWQKVRGTWNFPEGVAFAEAMLREPYHEIRGLGLLILLRFRQEFPASFPDRVRGWLQTDRLDNWALVGVFCPDALGPILEKDPKFVAQIKTWAGDPNRWVKRASAVSFIKLARRGIHLDAIYDIAVRLFPVQDDLIHKATGWLLREAGKADAPRLRAFLLKHGPAIPRTSLRYAIERFSETERKSLLAKTKAVKP